MPKNSKLKDQSKPWRFFLSPGNHEFSANQPVLILPNSDEQHHGKGETGGPEITLASYFRKFTWNFSAQNSNYKNEFQATVTHLVQKTFERFLWKDQEVAHVLKVDTKLFLTSQSYKIILSSSKFAKICSSSLPLKESQVLNLAKHP